MGLFGMMSYDEAMETLIEEAASKSVLEKAYKRIRKNEYDKSIGRIALHGCFRELYGLGVENFETCAEEQIFGAVWASVYKGDFDEETLQLVEKLLKQKPDFNRQANDTALNMQADHKAYKYAVVYLIFAYLYGCGFEPNIEKAEEYAEKSEALGDEYAAVWKTRIEAVKNGK